MICRSTTPRSTASRSVSGTCSSPTWPRRRPSSRACSSRADVSARRYGSSPRRTRGRRSRCRRSRPRSRWRRPTRRNRTCFGARPRDMSVPSTRAGLRDVAEWDVDVELVTRSPAQYWEMISDHVSLAVAALQQVDEPARARIRANAMTRVSAFENHGEVRVPGVARCILGTKPDGSRTVPRAGTRIRQSP